MKKSAWALAGMLVVCIGINSSKAETNPYEMLPIQRGSCASVSHIVSGSMSDNLEGKGTPIYCDSLTTAAYKSGKVFIQFSGSSGIYGFTFPMAQGENIKRFPVDHVYIDNKMELATRGMCQIENSGIGCVAEVAHRQERTVVSIVFHFSKQ